MPSRTRRKNLQKPAGLMLYLHPVRKKIGEGFALATDYLIFKAGRLRYPQKKRLKPFKELGVKMAGIMQTGYGKFGDLWI